jgi:hypothetical protein
MVWGLTSTALTKPVGILRDDRLDSISEFYRYEYLDEYTGHRDDTEEIPMK